MMSKQPQLRSALGAETASAFGGGSAGANVGVIQALPQREKAVARDAFADSLSTIWIVYVVFSGVGLLISFLITRNVLNKQHEETKTGLEEEVRKREERKQERKDRKAKKLGGSHEELPAGDAEAGAGAGAAGEKEKEGI
jgi:mannitol-specific phosphotransferase system IIBC component